MFAQHPGNQGTEGGAEREKEEQGEENHTAAKSSWVFLWPPRPWGIIMGKNILKTYISTRQNGSYLPDQSQSSM